MQDVREGKRPWVQFAVWMVAALIGTRRPWRRREEEERSFEYIEFECLWVLDDFKDLLFILLGLLIE